MATTIQTLDAVLKNFYAKAVVDQLNQEVLALELFEKAKLDWSGKKVVIPVHLARNSGVGFRAEGAALPTAGQQGYAELNVFAKFLYGRFKLTGPSISAAKGAYSFGNYVDLELRKLVEDVRNRANLSTLHGAAFKGYTTASIAVAANAAATGLPYYGNAQQLADIVAGLAVGQTLRVIFHKPGGNPLFYDRQNAAPANPSLEIAVTAVNVAQQTIDIANPLGGSALDTRYSVAGNAPLRGRPYSLKFFVEQGAVVVNDFSEEFTGACHNISSDVHFGVNRTATAGTIQGRDNLTSTSVLCISTSAVDADYNAFQALTLGRMQTVVDNLDTDSGKTPDMLLMNPSLRQSYTSLLTGGAGAQNIYKFVDKVGVGDGGFQMSGLGFNGIPMKTSKDCGKAMIFFLHTKAWHLAELEKSGFADLDGAIVSRVADEDAYQGYYRMYCDIYCDEPKANGVLTQISFV